MDETPIITDDIREKINNIEDKPLALDILQCLSDCQKWMEEKKEIIEKAKERETELLKQNNELFTKVSAAIDGTVVPPIPDFSGEALVNNIIEELMK